MWDNYEWEGNVSIYGFFDVRNYFEKKNVFKN